MRKVTMPNFYINFLNKTVKSLSILCDFAVAPFTGAWIKIYLPSYPSPILSVAPFTGAWIKIDMRIQKGLQNKSHPSRVRGLKLYSTAMLSMKESRTLHGCVD